MYQVTVINLWNKTTRIDHRRSCSGIFQGWDWASSGSRSKAWPNTVVVELMMVAVVVWKKLLLFDRLADRIISTRFILSWTTLITGRKMGPNIKYTFGCRVCFSGWNSQSVKNALGPRFVCTRLNEGSRTRGTTRVDTVPRGALPNSLIYRNIKLFTPETVQKTILCIWLSKSDRVEYWGWFTGDFHCNTTRFEGLLA